MERNHTTTDSTKTFFGHVGGTQNFWRTAWAIEFRRFRSGRGRRYEALHPNPISLLGTRLPGNISAAAPGTEKLP